jgi:hypothetical protein
MESYIIGFAVVLVFYLYWNTTETFNNKAAIKPSTIILLGDSILKNNIYVEDGQSVEDYLSKKTEATIHCFAKDDSVIINVYTQLYKLHANATNSNTNATNSNTNATNSNTNATNTNTNATKTCIFLSIGGNDILRGEETISRIFKQYIELVEKIQEDMPKTKIVLINLYYPTDEKYQKYYSSIQKWNELLEAYATDQQHIDVLDASIILTTSSDFTYDIEPSEIGGNKLANKIASISI